MFYVSTMFKLDMIVKLKFTFTNDFYLCSNINWHFVNTIIRLGKQTHFALPDSVDIAGSCAPFGSSLKPSLIFPKLRLATQTVYLIIMCLQHPLLCFHSFSLYWLERRVQRQIYPRAYTCIFKDTFLFNVSL